MEPHAGDVFVSFFPFLIIFVGLAIGNYFIAGRMGRNKILWVVLTLIPIVNFVFMYYVIYAVILYVLDKLNAVTDRASQGSA
ncbi:MAG: hypothetical protein HOK98_02460 [Rhodospirillaceae bacterium]|jgi:hypothetical protein|nr:hypothetical protein [Rhodospirillaceae bacterium]MBT6405791.1 hypothetical protein [Rhodospirillaceae bacterium]MBT6535019.1 hypothetical protein [Rhodospirillaceae bacterium]MBT7361241.1 hypothetical protein [Rhodospirillaceae bacterium]